MTPQPADRPPAELSAEPTKAPPDALLAEMIIPLLACGLAIYFLISTSELAWEARATGSMVAYVLLGLCLALFLRGGLRAMRGTGQYSFGDLFENSLFNRQRVGLVALLVLFIATIPWLGTTLGIFLLLLASLRLMGVTNATQLLGISLTSSAVVYLLFIFLLNSRMPRGLIEKALATILPPIGG